MNFDGRTVIVTGGTGSLGTAVVARLLAAGATCRVPYLNERIAAAYIHRDRVELLRCDLTDEAAVAGLYAGVTPWASIHLAGGFAMSAVADTGKAELMAMIEANLLTAQLCLRAAVAAFGNEGGRIVNVAARPAMEPHMAGGMSAYAASKAAVVALTQAAATELKERKILVNAVAPSTIDTPMNRAAMPDADHARWPTPQEIAEAIVFLASPENVAVSGAVVPLYGRT